MPVALAALLPLTLAVTKPPPRRFLSVDTRERTANIALIAGYDGENSGFNFDGYARGELQVIVPLRWRVVVRCGNRSPVRHSCAVVHGPMSVRPAFRGATIPHARFGLGRGQSASFSFRPTRVGAIGWHASFPATSRHGCGICSRSSDRAGRASGRDPAPRWLP